MKRIATLVLATVTAMIFTGCHPNTGHTLATDDSLVIDANCDWTVTWTLTAPEARRELRDRVRDAIWNYRVDGGSWQQTKFSIAQANVSTVEMRATVPKVELAHTTAIEAYLVYKFDGNAEGVAKAATPRRITINKAEPSGAANGSQPVPSETNRTASAAGSPR